MLLSMAVAWLSRGLGSQWKPVLGQAVLGGEEGLELPCCCCSTSPGAHTFPMPLPRATDRRSQLPGPRSPHQLLCLVLGPPTPQPCRSLCPLPSPLHRVL